MFSSSSSSLSLDSSDTAALQQHRRPHPSGSTERGEDIASDNVNHASAAATRSASHHHSSNHLASSCDAAAHHAEDPTWHQRQPRGTPGSDARDESPPGVTAPPTLKPKGLYRRSPPPPGSRGAAPRSQKTLLTSEDIDALVQEQYRLYGSDSPSPSKDRVAVRVAGPNTEGEAAEAEDANAILAEHHFGADGPPRHARDDELVHSSHSRSPRSAGAALDARDSAAYLQLYQSSLTSMASSANTSRCEGSPPPHEMILSALTEEMERLGLNEDDARAPSVAPAPTPSPASSPIPKREREAEAAAKKRSLAEPQGETKQQGEEELPSPTRQRFERTPSPHSYVRKEDGKGKETAAEEEIVVSKALSPPQPQRDADMVDSPRPADPRPRRSAEEGEEEERRQPSSRRSLFQDELTATEPREASSKSHTVEPPRPAASSSSSSQPRRDSSASATFPMMEVTVEELEGEEEADTPAPTNVSPLANVRWVTPTTNTFTERPGANGGGGSAAAADHRPRAVEHERKEDRHHTSSVISAVSSSAFCGPAASGLLATQYTPLAADVRRARQEEEEEARRPPPSAPQPSAAATPSRIRFSSIVSGDASAMSASTSALLPLQERPRGSGVVALGPTSERPSFHIMASSADTSSFVTPSFTQPWQRWAAGAPHRSSAVLDGALHTGGGTNRQSHAVVPRAYHVDTDAYRAYAQSEDEYFYPTQLERVTERSGMSGTGVLGPRARATAVLEARDRYTAAVGDPARQAAGRTQPPPPPSPAPPLQGERLVPFVSSPQRQAAIITTNVLAPAAAVKTGAATTSDSRLLSPHFVLRPSMAATTADVRRPLQFGGEDTPRPDAPLPTAPPPPATTTRAQPSRVVSTIQPAPAPNTSSGRTGHSAVRFSGKAPQTDGPQRSSAPPTSRGASSPPPSRATAVPLQQVPFISGSEARDASGAATPAGTTNPRLSAERIANLQAQERHHLLDMYAKQKALEAEAAAEARRRQHSSGTVSVSLSTPRRESPSVDQLVETPKPTSSSPPPKPDPSVRVLTQQEQQLRAHIRHNEQQTQLLEQQRVLREEVVHRARVELLADHGAQEIVRELHFCQTVDLLRREAAVVAAAREQSAARAAETETAAVQEEEKKRVLRRVRREQCELASELDLLSRELQSLVKQ